jgi:hypothetical protein
VGGSFSGHGTDFIGSFLRSFFLRKFARVWSLSYVTSQVKNQTWGIVFPDKCRYRELPLILQEFKEESEPSG